MTRVSDCDYCGNITVVGSDSNGGEACRSCLASLPEDKKAEHQRTHRSLPDVSEYRGEDYGDDDIAF